MPRFRLPTMMVALFAISVGVSRAEGSAFVTREGPLFAHAGRPFHVAGANCYYLMVYAADPGLRSDVDEVLNEAALMGLNTVRTWAFNDGSGWNALQTAPGVYDEQVFAGLDYVLDTCSELGLRVILPVVNNWVDYGGMDQYVAWSPTAQFHDDFYTDLNCRNWYKDHASALINRVNTVNGRLYRDDPSILAWELANEPRCPSDASGNTLQAWIELMSQHIKSIDSNHLVGVGSEGFYDDPGPGPWYLNGSEGVDYIRNHQTQGIDFAGSHNWPDHWGISTTTAVSLITRQLSDANVTIQKPFVLGEFGKLRDGAAAASAAHYDPATYFSPGVSPYPVPGADPLEEEGTRVGDPPTENYSPFAATLGTATRDAFFEDCFDLMIAAEAGGAVYWISYHDLYPDYDGFGVYYPADSSTVTVIETFAEAMTDLSTTGVEDVQRGVTRTLRVGAAYPNPFTQDVRFSVKVDVGEDPAPVHVIVYDIRGRRVCVLMDEQLGTGTFEVRWRGRDERGIPMPAGVYFAAVRSGAKMWTRRLIRVP